MDGTQPALRRDDSLCVSVLADGRGKADESRKVLAVKSSERSFGEMPAPDFAAVGPTRFRVSERVQRLSAGDSEERCPDSQ